VSVENDLPPTIGALHDRIEQLYGPRGWRIFQQLFHEAAGLRVSDGTKSKEEVLKDAGNLNAVTAGDAKPLNCDAIEPGLVQAILQAPTRVQRWLLAPPRDSPRWRTSLPPDGMDDGNWCGC
jgi:hypothetical protein